MNGVCGTRANPIVAIRVFAVVLAIFLAAKAKAAELLVAELTSVATQPRAGAPMWVELKLTSKSARLREGNLEFTHRVLGEPQWNYLTQELAITGGTQTYRF